MRKPRLLQNPGLRILSVLLATLLWFWVENEKIGFKRVEASLDYLNMPEGMILVPGSPATVKTVIRGPEALLPRIQDGGLKARVDLRGDLVGENVHLISASDVQVPYWAEVEGVEPQQVAILLDLLATKMVPVLPKVMGSVARGYLFKDYVVNPSRVKISGPASVIAGIGEIWTEPILIDGAEESFQRLVDLRADRPGVIIEGSMKHSVQLVVSPEIVERLFEDIPVVVQSLQSLPELEPERVDVRLAGPRLTLDRISFGQLQAVLDLQGLAPREAPYELEPVLRFIPPFAGQERLHVSFLPAEVRVRIGLARGGPAPRG
jgi:YbbR domain-containing protein